MIHFTKLMIKCITWRYNNTSIWQCCSFLDEVKIFYEYTIITKEGHSWYEATIKAYLTILTKTRLKVKDHRESKTIVCVYYFHPDSASIKYESNTAFQRFFCLQWNGGRKHSRVYCLCLGNHFHYGHFIDK